MMQNNPKYTENKILKELSNLINFNGSIFKWKNKIS